MRILWVGWGDLARRASASLLAAGHELLALRRSPIDDPPRGVIPVRGDLAAPGGLQLPADIQACVMTLTPDTRDVAGYERAYLTTQDNLYSLLNSDALAPRVTLERFIFVSSTAVYGQDDGSWVEESTLTSPSSFRGTVMVGAEALAATAPAHRRVVARLAGIYGPGRDRLVRRIRRGEAVADRWTNRIHADDAGTALAHLVTAPDPLVPDVVNVVDTEPARTGDVTSFVAGLLGVPAPPVEAGDGVGKRVDGTRLLTTGFRHRHPTYREGYRALLES